MPWQFKNRISRFGSRAPITYTRKTNKTKPNAKPKETQAKVKTKKTEVNNKTKDAKLNKQKETKTAAKKTAITKKAAAKKTKINARPTGKKINKESKVIEDSSDEFFSSSDTELRNSTRVEASPVISDVSLPDSFTKNSNIAKETGNKTKQDNKSMGGVAREDADEDAIMISDAGVPEAESTRIDPPAPHPTPATDFSHSLNRLAQKIPARPATVVNVDALEELMQDLTPRSSSLNQSKSAETSKNQENKTVKKAKKQPAKLNDSGKKVDKKQPSVSNDSSNKENVTPVTIENETGADDANNTLDQVIIGCRVQLGGMATPRNACIPTPVSQLQAKILLDASWFYFQSTPVTRGHKTPPKRSLRGVRKEVRFSNEIDQQIDSNAHGAFGDYDPASYSRALSRVIKRQAKIEIENQVRNLVDDNNRRVKAALAEIMREIELKNSDLVTKINERIEKAFAENEC